MRKYFRLLPQTMKKASAIMKFHSASGRLALLISLLPVLVHSSSGADARLRAHYLFSPDRQLHSELKPSAGGPGARIEGPIEFTKATLPPRAEFNDREGSLIISDDFSKLSLPTGELSVEAWVRLDKPAEWGAFIGAIQDNGSYERGWMLGYRGSRFAFAIASENAKALTYMTSSTDFEPGRWYHLAGVYDGASMKLYVNGTLENSSEAQSGPIEYPPTGFYQIGAYHDDDEYYRMQGAIHEIKLYEGVLSADAIAATWGDRRDEFPEPRPKPQIVSPSYGPFMDWTGRYQARFYWETDDAMPTRYTLDSPHGDVREGHSDNSVTEHEVTFDNLKPDVEYFFTIRFPDQDGRPVLSSRYMFDTSFFYWEAPDPGLEDPYADGGNESTDSASAGAIAADILEHSAISQGYAVVVDGTTGELARELAVQSRLKVVVLFPDHQSLQKGRHLLDKSGLYGVRVHAFGGSLEDLPFGPYFANLVISEKALLGGTGEPETAPSSVMRILRPSGGQVLVGIPPDQPGHVVSDWVDGLGSVSTRVFGASRSKSRYTFVQSTRGMLDGAGEWTHQYGDAANTSCSGDEIVGGEMKVMWWGDPGPRPMPDRGPRNPAPLMSNGRMYVQGDRILFGMDAYNGTILWNFTNPEMRRANLPRDCSNTVASSDYLYLAHGRYALAIDGQTGSRDIRFVNPADAPAAPHDWGYISVIGDYLLGSSVKTGSRYMGDDGEWYENFDDSQTSRVVSDRLFGFNRKDPSAKGLRFQYEGGAIINSTITIGDGTIYFIESRNQEAIDHPAGRLPISMLTDQHLVALDLETGKRLWEKSFDFSNLEFMSYLVYSNDTLVATGTDRNKNFHLYAFDTALSNTDETGEKTLIPTGGKLLWQESHKEDKGHHSGHLQHPVVIGNTFLSDQRSFDLRSGEILSRDLPERRGCGTMSAALNSVFFRHYFHGMWDLKTDERTQFEGIRSGCWLSLIPAGGLLLAPETSAGCSCTHSIQTTVAYIPTALQKLAAGQ